MCINIKLSEFLEKNLTNSNKTNDFVSDFLQELKSHLNKAELNIENNSKFVVTDINNNTVSLIDISNGNELETTDISKEDLNNLDLGSNIIFKDNKFALTNEKFEITNRDVKLKLEDLYFCLEEENNDLFSVQKIDDNKIYLTNLEEGGYFSISSEKYPDFKVNDILKKVDGKYTLQQ